MTQGIRSGEPDAREIYADIIDLPHHQSVRHPHMSMTERAAQFSPFAALTGYEDMVAEEAREVGQQRTLSEIEREQLDETLSRLAELLESGEHPLVTITYFVPDERKNGGAYETITEQLRRIDPVFRQIELLRKTGISGQYMTIGMEQITEIR